MNLKLIDLPDLPTLPEVMTRILEAANDPNTSSEKLASMLEKDHAISARVLRMANSAFYARLKPADSVHRAIVVVGFDAVKSLALATSVFDTLSGRAEVGLDVRDFWIHSLGTATSSKLLAELAMPPSAAACFTAGMLHDIGKYVMALVLGKDYEKLTEAASAEMIPLRVVEKRELGVTHTTIGRWVAEKWRFPKLIVDVITFLYEPDSYDGPHQKELAAVVLSDLLAQQLGLGKAGEAIDPVVPGSVLGHLGLDLAGLGDFTERLKESVEDVANFFHVLRGQEA